MKKEYKKCIEIDTDGIITCTPVDLDGLNDRIAQLYTDTFGTDECYMALEEDEFGAGYFYRAKNYIILTVEGKLIRHGVKFKSSRYAPIYQRAMNILAQAMLEGGHDLREMALALKNLEQYSLDDFKMKAKLTKDPDHYDNPNSLHAKLGKKLRAELGADPGKEQIEYVVMTGRNYELATKVTNISQLDREYYYNELEKVFELFGVPKPEQLSLF
tara:strand:- start:600 stop:1244 length:645 start_codon:yes stop_codon:yes gene_type:complete